MKTKTLAVAKGTKRLMACPTPGFYGRDETSLIGLDEKLYFDDG
jgi:hypothetical protein